MSNYAVAASECVMDAESEIKRCREAIVRIDRFTDAVEAQLLEYRDVIDNSDDHLALKQIYGSAILTKKGHERRIGHLTERIEAEEKRRLELAEALIRERTEKAVDNP